MRRAWLALLSVTLASFAVTGLAATADVPDTLSPTDPVLTWTGEQTGAAAGDAGCTTTPSSCDSRDLTMSVPVDYWASHPGGVVVRIDWATPDTELDLAVVRDPDSPNAETVGSEYYGGRNHQQVYLAAPSPGTYRVEVSTFDAAATTYTGSATLVSAPEQHAGRLGPPMTFRDGLVDPQILTDEPGIAFSPDGAMYVDAPQGLQDASSLLWRSSDSGGTFSLLQQKVAGAGPPPHQACLTGLGGGDSDAVVDRTGRVYLAALQGLSISVSVQPHNGAAWTCNPVANAKPEDDRPWLAAAPTADGDGPGVDAYLAYVDTVSGQLPVGRDLKPGAIYVDATTDGGITWSPTGVLPVATPATGALPGPTVGAGDVPVPGRIVTTKTPGELYQPYGADEGVYLAHSTDNGRTWTTSLVSQRYGDPDNNWVSAAADTAGKVWVVWTDSGSFQTVLAQSADHGQTWATPVIVNPAGQQTLLPSVAATEDGSVAVAWYGANTDSMPDYATTGTPWNVWVARGLPMTHQQPEFVVTQATQAPVHLGPVCTLDCVGNHGRLGDFLTVAFAPRGQLVLAYSDNNRVDTSSDPPVSYLVVARQVLSHANHHGGNAQPNEPTGDALADDAALDFTSTPRVDPSTDTVSVGIAGADDLTAALHSGTAGHATDATWLLVWTCNGHVDWAGMHLSSSSDQPTFFGGRDPEGLKDDSTLRELALTYPAKFRLEGGLDIASRTFSIRLDARAFGTSHGAVMRRLQAFSFVGTGPANVNNLLTQIDATSAVDAQL